MQRLGLLCLAIWIVLLATTPLYAGNYIVRTAIIIAMYSVLAYSWNFIGGMTGYPSFSTAAFFGMGAYAGAIAQRNGAPMMLAWTLATLVVTVFAAALGAILLRLKGHYFAIGSIAVVEVCRLIVSSWGSLTGGGDGLNVPLLRWRPDQVSLFFLAVIIAILVTVVGLTIFVMRSRLGFGLRCIQQNEDAANMVGVNTTAYKVSAYVLSAMFCGTIGAAYASWTGYIDPTESFQILMSLKIPVMVLLGGAGTVLGPAIGTTAFILLEEVFWSNFLDWNRAILGAVIVVLIFFIPGGLLNLPVKRLFTRERVRQARSPA